MGLISPHLFQTQMVLIHQLAAPPFFVLTTMVIACRRKYVSPSDTSAKTEIFDVIATPDSGLLAVGQILFSNGQQKSYMVKLDANGNLFNPMNIVERKKDTFTYICIPIRQQTIPVCITWVLKKMYNLLYAIYKENKYLVNRLKIAMNEYILTPAFWQPDFIFVQLAPRIKI